MFGFVIFVIIIWDFWVQVWMELGSGYSVNGGCRV